MYPNLLGQKAAHHLSDDDMARILGVSRAVYQSKQRSGRFTPSECRTLCRHFQKSFAYLFAEDGEDSANSRDARHAAPGTRENSGVSAMKDMAYEYRVASAKLAMSIVRHKQADDLSPDALRSLQQSLRDTRATARLLSGYYEFPRQEELTLLGLTAGRLHDDG